MIGISPERVPLLVIKDVETVRKEARFVFDICSPRLEIFPNPSGRLGVIAVVGPSEFGGRTYRETDLCEVGIGVSRPYHRSGKPMQLLQLGEKTEIPRRRKWFTLSKAQYLAVAPALFELLQRLTIEKVFSWKHGFFSDDPYLVRTERNYWSRHQRKFFHLVTWKPQPSGVRFSVSKKDKLLLSDIYWVEFDSPMAKRRLSGLAKYIDLLASPYKKGFQRRFSTLKGVAEAEISLTWLRRRAPYLLPEILRFIPKGEKNPFWSCYAELLNYKGETDERELANSALANSEDRLNGVLLRVTTGLDTKRDYIVFEVSPLSARDF